MSLYISYDFFLIIYYINMEYIPNDFEKPPSLYNGRVNLMNNDSNATNNNHENAFLMQDRIPIKSNDYNDALQGEIHDTKLSKAYFSFENQEIIQNGLRKGVYDLSKGKYLIDRQDPHIIQMVMRTTFLEHANHNVENITSQIQTLNELVLSYFIPKAFGEVEAYLKYKRDISTIAQPMAHPVLARQSKQLEQNIGL